MAGSHSANLAWLIEEFSARLASVFEGMAGERPSIAHASGRAPSAAEFAAGLLWRQPFAGVPGALRIFASETAWTFAAEQILHAAGMEDSDRETLESTYLETIGQAFGGLAQTVSARLGREITPASGEKIPGVDGTGEEAGWIALELTFGAGTAAILASPDAAFLDSLSVPRETTDADEPEDVASTSAGGASKTFDLLLDVEMPVSVSFGRAKVPLKDVLKLTTGSIVELNRSLIEPVEVIVNNCVIARGEVVVVEGNFGVRIQQVVSRRERLRTLN